MNGRLAAGPGDGAVSGCTPADGHPADGHPAEARSPEGRSLEAPSPEGRYVLLGADGRPYRAERPGTLGGYRRGRLRIYGRPDCPSALRALAAGGYRRNRVFFADEPTAIAAGYRPCAVCLPVRYTRWKEES
ncbi:metal-binding protein [Streptomyces sp. NBC_01186]|uniref:Ada metal-binding domain-containing protein n=1 Tax=Streptomyces sp. NBC_01186 TaxID=2903765 RepID=UPI002E0DBF8A|nr:metal-binding protein [Streptomyces sp. NBC_01186]